MERKNYPPLLYKTGDKVRVKQLDYNGSYCMRSGKFAGQDICPTRAMCNLSGQVVTIERADGCYYVKEDPDKWNWADDMFEPVSPFLSNNLL